MSDKILRALLQLFAILGKSGEKEGDSRKTVSFFLKQLLNAEQVEDYLTLYDGFLLAYENNNEGEKQRKRTAVSSVKILVICEQINEALNQKQKVLVLIRLIEYINASGGIVNEQEFEFVQTVASSFNLSEEEFDLLFNLCTNNQLATHPQLLKISASPSAENEQGKHLHCESLSGEIFVLQMKSTGVYFLRYTGKMALNHNGQNISDNRVHQLSQGSSIRGSKIHTIYYTDIVGSFLSEKFKNPLEYSVKNIMYRFPDGEVGLHPLSFEEGSGKLIGIMGGSGAGKSTLLNILNGNENPDEGAVYINGVDLHKENDVLEGVIGFVSQDDLLIEDLTVFENLFFNAQLCFPEKEKKWVVRRVEQTLTDLGLFDVRHLKVGSPLDKTISGGQRKRLNISLELIREPGVLFVDEPTSGLSSRDSEIIIDLLKELALKGKLVFVVIHQPSSDIFKVFDKLLILDKGGYPIYWGNPVESITHFKTAVNFINPSENECASCGNVNPEQVFNIIETRVLDENGLPTKKRKVSPKEWNKLFYSSTPEVNAATGASPIHKTYTKPGLLYQFRVFFTRDVLSKVANKQYLTITLLEAPVLAFILSYMTRYCRPGMEYSFGENKNMVAYLFMSVVVALFLGLTVSAEEIFRDRKIRKRETFLNLSKGSYLLAKTIILIIISAIQTSLFVFIGNNISGVAELNLHYWMVLFSVSLFANILGLNISSAFKSAVTIYILIPFLIIPQLLLSGVLVRYDELNPGISSRGKVPFWGDVMVSRWAFEALAVARFTENTYQKNIYPLEKEVINYSFIKNSWIPKMKTLLDSIQKQSDSETTVRKEWLRVMKKNPPANLSDHSALAGMRVSLDSLKGVYIDYYDKAVKKRDQYLASFQNSKEKKDLFSELKQAYHNERIADVVKNPGIYEESIFEEDGALYPSENNIYFDANPNSPIRSHFYAPNKYLAGHWFATPNFNVLVILGMTLLAWIALYFEWLAKLMNGAERFSKKLRRKSNARI